MLELRFSARPGRIEVACDPSHVRQLQALRSRFSTSAATSLQSFDVETDDLLVNLYELAQWPSTDVDVRWQTELLALVEGNAADAAVVQMRLGAAESAPVLVDDEPVPHVDHDGLVAQLATFQRRDFGKLLELSHGANFSVPGAGKTRVALALFEARRLVGEVTRMMVVCPKSAFESWQEEIRICYPNDAPSLAILDGPSPPACDVLLVNYERLPDARLALLRWLQSHPALLVLDEAHRMKLGPAGAWGSVCLSLGPYAARRLILTGTPAPNGAKDLENLMAFVWPGQGRAAVARAIQGNDLRTASRLLRPLFARTTKDQLGLPEITVAIRRVELPTIHRDLYRALLGQASATWSGGDQSIEALGRVTLYLLMAATTPALLATGASRYEPLPYQVPPLDPPRDSSLATLLRDLPLYEMSPKYQEVVRIVTANADGDEPRKTLVWSTFVRNLTSLASLLASFNPAVVHGGTEDRAEQLRRFREDPNCMVLLSNPATLGEGVSLHHVCHEAIYVDRDFAAGRFLQSLDRIHRLGLDPETKTRATVLLANETIDELVASRLAIKLDFMGHVLDDPEVLALGDLDEEPTETVGMDGSDMDVVLEYLKSGDRA